MNQKERSEERIATMLSNGYIEIPRHNEFATGDRVRHGSHRWPDAIDGGTGTIERVLHKPNSAWAQKYKAEDVELVIANDDGSYGTWASYHTVKIDPSRPTSSTP